MTALFLTELLKKLLHEPKPPLELKSSRVGFQACAISLTLRTFVSLQVSVADISYQTFPGMCNVPIKVIG